MKFEHRAYQEEAAEALYAAIRDPQCKPVIAVPTGAGKTWIMSLFFKKYLKENPDNEILVLSHTQNIVEQDAAALEIAFPDKTIAVYSSGLGRKEHAQITVGGIQSVIKNPKKFRWANLVLIDEVHSVNHGKVGSYRKLLDKMHSDVVGMSATVFRTGHGYIYKGKDTLFNHLAYDLTSIENFNKLVDDGYLTKLISVAPKTQLDSSKVKKSGGDYNVRKLSEEHNTAAITEQAIQDALYYGKKYNHWLVFAIDITHAIAICDSLNVHGIKSDVLHSRMSADRTAVLDSFHNGEIRALVSVGMLTTGYDSPQVDLILMLRPTMSAVLHVQMIGRGLRVHPGKEHCLVLDYAGNTARLGPINDVIVPKSERDGKGVGEAPTKNCPKCATITYTRAKVCESCGHEFVFEVKITKEASTAEMLATSAKKKEVWLKVDTIQYSIHRKPGKPDSILIIYHCGIQRIKEYLLVEYGGYAGRLAIHKLAYRGYKGKLTSAHVYQARATLKKPTSILVDFSSKYKNITNARFQ